MKIIHPSEANAGQQNEKPWSGGKAKSESIQCARFQAECPAGVNERSDGLLNNFHCKQVVHLPNHVR